MKPKVIVIAGLPMSGKTTLGKALSQKTGLHFVDIDEGPASCAPPQETDPYHSEEARVRERARMTVAYSILHAAVKANLTQGFSLIIAATYSRHATQDFLWSAAKHGGGDVKIIWCKYHDTEEEIERRITGRIASNAIGGCRSVSHYIEDKSRYEGIKFPHIALTIEGGEGGTNKAVEQALKHIGN